MLNYVKKIINLAFNGFAYYLSKLMPKKKGSIVIGSGQGYTFSDNSMFFYIWCVNKANRKIDICWITKSESVYSFLKNKGLPCEKLYSLRGIYRTLSADRSFISHRLSDIHSGLIGGSKIIQLWHGVPLRRIGYNGDWYSDDLIGKIKKIIYKLFPFSYYMACDILISNCSYSSRVYSEAFAYSFRNKKRILQLGQPRYDYLLGNTKIYDDFFNDELAFLDQFNGYDKVVAWLPTHRFFQSKNFIKILDDSGFSLSELDEWLKAKNVLLIFKLHPIERKYSSAFDCFKNIVVYDFIDPSPLLKKIDILISDYSSVVIDYLSMKKPVYLVPFDLQEYEAYTGFYLSYKDDMSGFICNGLDDLFNALSACSVNIDCKDFLPMQSDSYCFDIYEQCVCYLNHE